MTIDFDLIFEQIISALQDFSLKDKDVLFLGPNSCKFAALGLAHDARRVSCVDINFRTKVHPLIESINWQDFIAGKIKINAAFCILAPAQNSQYDKNAIIENSLKILKILHKVLLPSGILFLNLQQLENNQGPILGWPMAIMRNWGFLASYSAINSTRSPLYVLCANEQALHIPPYATPQVRTQIITLAKSKAFDIQFYIEQYPDIMTGQMDALSHYVIYGANEGRNPTKNFNTGKYQKDNPSVDWTKINPFLHYMSTYGAK